MQRFAHFPDNFCKILAYGNTLLFWPAYIYILGQTHFIFFRSSRQSNQTSSFYTISEGSLYGYSAYYDNRQPDKRPFGVVRVFGLYNKEMLGEMSAIQCHLHYHKPDGGHISLVPLFYYLRKKLNLTFGNIRKYPLQK